MVRKATELPTKKADPTVAPTKKDVEHQKAMYQERYEKLKKKGHEHLMSREGLIALGLAEPETKVAPSLVEGPKEREHHAKMEKERQEKLKAKGRPHQKSVHTFIPAAKGQLGTSPAQIEKSA